MPSLARLLVLLLVAAGAHAAPAKLNIVLIVADDLGARDLSCDGADLHRTPGIDALAKSGVRFTQAYSASPICTPARAALLTGRHPARLGITTWSEDSLTPSTKNKLLPAPSLAALPLAEVTIAECLARAGYTTGHVGKWHLGSEGFSAQGQGFEFSVGGSHWGAPQTHFWPYNGNKRFRGEFRFVPGLRLGASGDYLADALTDETLWFMDDARRRERPFFLYLAHYAPHTPIEAKAADIEKARRRLEPGDQHQNVTYAAMVENLDENVARVVEYLDKNNLRDSTLIIFTSDNGGFINFDTGTTVPVTTNHPLRSGKGSLYEGGIRVPLIVSGPGIRTGVSDQPVCLTDLFPTLLRYAGAEPQPVEDGVDLTALLTSDSGRLARQDLFWHFPHYYPTSIPASAVRSGEWKLIEYAEDGRIELYNLTQDEVEKNNIAAQFPAQAGELKAKLHAWRRNAGAKMATPNPAFSAR